MPASTPLSPPPDAPHHQAPPSVGFLVLGRKRPGFDAQWGRQIEATAWQALASLPFRVVRAPATAVDETTLRAALDSFRTAGCATLAVLQPTMGDGSLAPTLAELWDRPVVFWSTTERQDGDCVSACTLVGTHVWASYFAQTHHPFELVNAHPQDRSLPELLGGALRRTTAATRLAASRVGLIGAHAPGFVNLHVDPRPLQRALGVRVRQFGLQEFYDAIDAVPADQVQPQVRAIQNMQLPTADEIPAAALTATARYELALRGLLELEELDALAVRCWPELPNIRGCWPYLALARLGEQGCCVAMEGDLDGAVNLWLGKILGYGVGYISDWLEHDQHHLTLWHQGEAPPQWCEPASLSLGRHFNNQKPVVLNGMLKADQPITLTRLWHYDGRYRLMAVDGQTARPHRRLKGTYGVAILADRDIPAWFDGLCHAGMPHHLVLFQGHHTAELKRFARLLGLSMAAQTD